MLQRSPHTKRAKPSRAKEPRATIDFESRSACDIKRGAWLYSRHDTTEILCLSYMLPGMTKPKLWHCAHPAIGIKETSRKKLRRLFDWIKRGGF